MTIASQLIGKAYRKAALCAGFALCAAAAGAAVTPDSVRFQWTDSTRLVVDLPETLNGYSLKSNYRLVVTPVLKGADGDSLVLQPVMYAGKRYRRYANREARLSHTEVEPMRLPDDTTRFSQEVTVQPWMRSQAMQLVLHRECEGCCRVKELPSQTVGSTTYRPPFVPQPRQVDKRVSVAEQLEANEPLLAPINEYQPYNESVPLRKQKHALVVHFPVSKADLREDFRNNSATLERIRQVMQRIEGDSLSKVVKVVIVGLASPEGPEALNRKLSEKRAGALRDYIRNCVSLPDEVFEMVAAGESWADLRDVVAESNLPERDEALAIIDQTEDPEQRERLIRRLNGGKLFRYLKQEVFVEQRNAGYIRAYYEVVPDANAEQINRAIGMLQSGQADEALQLLQGVKDDPRAYNALGSAYYLTGQREPAIRYYRMAAEGGDENARNNLLEIENK